MLRTRFPARSSAFGLLALAVALPLAACDSGTTDDDDPQVITRATITEVELTDYPATQPGGGGWETDGSDPDISFQMRDEFDDTVLEGGEQGSISPQELPIRWTLTDSQNDIPEVILTRSAFDEDYRFCAIENDITGDTDMGCTATFSLDSLVALDYPTTATITGTDDVEFDIRIRWAE